MRNRLLLLTAAVFLSACADDQPATSPSSRSGLASRSAAGDAAPSNGGIKVPDAKPADQVGFTKAFTVSTPLTVVPAGNSKSIAAFCPAGSVVIGGFYGVSSPPGDAVDLRYMGSALNTAANDWMAVLYVAQTAAVPSVGVTVTAICAQ